MAFSKKFPKDVEGSNYPEWKEIILTDEEEGQAEEEARREQFMLLDECLREAKSLAIKNQVNDDENVVTLALGLFDKRASHVVFVKEHKAKEKFDRMFKR
ncbi:hypothetical protein HQ489_05850 [Candidatus Woesearchaeota archaeon]|nr:hypothetical protein [Candidatus Woesearchaeota archaeon]